MFQFSIYVSNIKKSTFSSVQEALSFCPNKPTKKSSINYFHYLLVIDGN